MELVIVGGGTAGWVSALYAKQLYPSFNITVVESESIGILGAGEGTTPHFISFLDAVEIPFSDIVAECSGTVKSAIKFSGWSDVSESYYHPFSEKDVVSGGDESCGCSDKGKSKDRVLHSFIDLENNPTLEELVCEKGQTTFVPWASSVNKLKYNKIQDFVPLTNWAAHFDARKLAKCLSGIAQARGVKRIEGIVGRAEVGPDNNISQLQVGDLSIKTDIVIDATGFTRKFISGTYGAKWVDCSDRLPANRAMPFFLEQQERIPSFTEAIAMNCGWVWKIPTRERFGCGYVFSNQYISEDEACNEIINEVGFEPDFGKTFSFSAGYHNQIWKNNCLAVGLAAGFVEPLEATSIFQTLIILERFFTDRRHVFSPNEHMRDVFNSRYANETEQVVDFLYMHYVTSRADTDFWSKFSLNHTMSDFVKYLYEVAKYRHILDEDLPKASVFSPDSYMRIIYGSKMAEHLSVSVEATRLNMFELHSVKNLAENRMKMSQHCIDHRTFLDFITS